MHPRRRRRREHGIEARASAQEEARQRETRSKQKTDKRGGRKMRKTVIRILWYGLGLTFAYTLNELTRTTKLEKMLMMSDRNLLQTNKPVLQSLRERGHGGGVGIQKKKAEKAPKSANPKKAVIQITTGISKMDTVKGRG